MEKRPYGPPCNGGNKNWNKGGCGDGPNMSHGSEVQLTGNKWMCFYKRMECGWNYTHTSGFHVAWTNNKFNLSLPATHEFRINPGTYTVSSSKGEPDTH